MQATLVEVCPPGILNYVSAIVGLIINEIYRFFISFYYFIGGEVPRDEKELFLDSIAD